MNFIVFVKNHVLSITENEALLKIVVFIVIVSEETSKKVVIKLRIFVYPFNVVNRKIKL